MPFRPAEVSADHEGGEIDYRLARQSLLREFESGNLDRHDVCDAHPELRRAAAAIGDPTGDECPICTEELLVLVRYVFGPRLPSHGRCISRPGEMAKLAQRKGRFTCYVVEVCRGCAWNHLRRSYVLAASS